MSGNGSDPPSGGPTQSQENSQNKSKAMMNRKWKLKNAELKVIDIYQRTTSKISPPVIKLEVKLLPENETRIVGE